MTMSLSYIISAATLKINSKNLKRLYEYQHITLGVIYHAQASTCL